MALKPRHLRAFVERIGNKADYLSRRRNVRRRVERLRRLAVGQEASLHVEFLNDLERDLPLAADVLVELERFDIDRERLHSIDN